MKKTLTTFILIALAKLAFAQTVQYSYDNHGNRIQRKPVSGLSQRLINPTAGNLKFSMSSSNNDFSFYPNPSTGRVVFAINDYSFSIKSSISVLDQSGKEIKTLIVTSNKTEIDVSNLPDGIYIVKFVKNEVPFYYKLLKIK